MPRNTVKYRLSSAPMPCFDYMDENYHQTRKTIIVAPIKYVGIKKLALNSN